MGARGALSPRLPSCLPSARGITRVGVVGTTLVHLAVVVSTCLRASLKCYAEVPRSCVSLPTLCHRRGASPLCVAELLGSLGRG